MPSLRFHCSRDMLCDFYVVWVIQNELLDFLISLCELILMLLYPLIEAVFVKFIPIDRGHICQVYTH